MNYSGPFEFSHWSDATADGTVGVDGVVAAQPHADGPPTAAPTVVVNDASLLFSGDYKRSGLDLVLSKDGHDHIVSDYFKGSLRAALSSPDGATLSPDLIKALVGEVQVAQLAGGANAAAQVIGSVTKLTGGATAIRNGVSVMLNVGDNVQKGDVVQAGAESSLGLTFIDGTVFGLSSNARMVLNEMVYDPNGSSNSSLLSLVQGTITFVAGETAKHGDMRVDTPVATMGIRGTAVLVEIGFEVTGTNGVPVKFQVLVEPGGHVGSYFLYSKTNPTQIIGQVNQAGQVTSVTGTGDTSTGIADPLSPIAQGIIQQTLQQYFPNYVPNANPRSNGPGGGSAPSDPNSGTSPDPLKFIQPDGLPITVPINLPGSSPDTPPVNVTITRFNSAPTIVVAPVIVTLPVDKTSFDIKDQVQITDPDSGDVATPYVPGTAHIISVTGPNGTPSALDLKSLITVDPQTGHVSYNPEAFKFLPAGEKAVYTIGFDSQSGPDTTHETLTFTVDGTNDAPIVASVLTAAVSQADGAKSFSLLAGASDADLGETATLVVGNVKFALNGDPAQTTAPGGVTLDGTVVHVDPSAFAYLGEGEIATITVSYNIIDAHGAIVAQTETITITGVNDQPTVVSTNFTVPQGGEVDLNANSFGISDPDASSDFTFTVSNVTGGTFVVDQNLRLFRLAVVNEGEGQTITFTMADLVAGRVHFVSDGSAPPTFDLQVDDGSGTTNSSSDVKPQTAGYSDLAPVVDHPLTSAAHEGDCTVTVDLLTGVTDPEHDPISIDNVRFTTGDGEPSTEPPAGFSLDGTSLTYDPADSAFDHLGAGDTMTVVVSYDILDSKGAKTTQTETVTITGVNDRPVMTSAAFTVAEGGITILSAGDFGVTDPDDTSFTFTVSEVRHGKFQTSTDGINWTTDSTFTSAELAAGHVRFVHDGSEGDASFSIKANDGSGSQNSTSSSFGGTIDVTPVNDAPTLIAAPLLIAEGGTVVLSVLNFLVVDPDNNSFTFTVSDVEHGLFQIKINNSWVDATSFTTAELKAGHVRFVHDGGEVAPSYSVSADDGSTVNHTSNTIDSAVVFIPVNDAPTITHAEFSVTDGGTTVLHSSDILVFDPDSSSFRFTVSNVQAGHFEVYSHGHWSTATSFTTSDLNAGHVQFVQNGSDAAPSFSIKANDGSLVNANSAPYAGTIDFTHVNDNPVITSSSATASNSGIATGPNLVHNGGFESGYFSDWIQGGNLGYTSVSSYAHTGYYGAHLGPIGSDGTLTQHIATTAGQSYVLDFWLAHDGGGANDFTVLWNGAELLSVAQVPGQPYTHYTYEITATTSTTDLIFEFRQDPAYWNLDDVTIRLSGQDASGKLSFSDADHGDTHTASFAPSNGGAGYIGTFTLGNVAENNGSGSVSWNFVAAGSQTAALTSAVTQSYDVTIDDQHHGLATQRIDVSIGTAGADNFAFQRGIGTDVITNFQTSGPAADHLALLDFGIHNTTELHAMLQQNTQGDAVLALGHGDSITFAGVSTAQLNHVLDHIQLGYAV